MPFWLLCVAVLGLCTPLGSEPSPLTDRKFAFEYGIEWRLIRAGIARMTWAPDGASRQADLHIESAGLVSKLYRVKDDYRAQMDSALCATSVNIHAEEGKRRRDTAITFADGKATYSERDLLKNNAVVVAKETPIPECVHEYMGGLQRLRLHKLDPGQSMQVPLSDGKKAATVKVDAQEREEVTTPLGKFKTVRHEVHMFNNVLINKKARLFVWITDDERRLPVQIRVRMQFLIGTIELKLEKHEGTSNL
jgi:hypothetical protein